MADEATFQNSLTIMKRSTTGAKQLLNFQKAVSFRATVTGTKGPLPGSILVPLTGVAVSLSQLTTPSIAWLHHQGLADGSDPGSNPSIYYVEVGVKDVLTSRFTPLLELWPGEEYPLRLSRNLLESYNSTGTGTGPANNSLWVMSHGAACTLWIGAFEF